MAGSSRGKQTAHDNEVQGNRSPKTDCTLNERENTHTCLQEPQRGGPSNDPLEDKLQILSQEQRDRFLVQTLLTVTRRFEQITEEQNQKRGRPETLDSTNESLNKQVRAVTDIAAALFVWQLDNALRTERPQRISERSLLAAARLRPQI